MSLSDRLPPRDQREFMLIIDGRASARRGEIISVQVKPTKMRLGDADMVNWLLSEHRCPTALVMPKGTLWMLSEPGDGTVWYVGHGKPSKAQRAALEAVLEALAEEYPDIDVPLLDDEPTPLEASDE